MKKWLVIGVIVILAAVVVGAAWALNPTRSRLHSFARREWKNEHLTAIRGHSADQRWLTNELACLATNAADSDQHWLSDNLILTRNGDWLDYASACSKHEHRMHDIFVAHGSDGRWYYSTYHFCVGMVVLRMDEQPASLDSFVTNYALKTFDGKSDECLEKTWP